MFAGTTYLNLRFKAVQRRLEWGYDFFLIFQIKSIKIEKQNALLGWRNSILKHKKVYTVKSGAEARVTIQEIKSLGVLHDILI